MKKMIVTISIKCLCQLIHPLHLGYIQNQWALALLKMLLVSAEDDNMIRMLRARSNQLYWYGTFHTTSKCFTIM